MDQESEWAWGQNGPRVKMGHDYLLSEKVEKALNSKKETNGGVKMGQGF